MDASNYFKQETDIELEVKSEQDLDIEVKVEPNDDCDFEKIHIKHDTDLSQDLNMKINIEPNDNCDFEKIHIKHDTDVLAQYKEQGVYQIDVMKESFNQNKPDRKIHNLKKKECSSYTCPICKKMFILKTDFMMHLETNSVEKPSICNICNMALKKKSLVEHYQIHLNEVPITCNRSSNAFMQRSRVNDYLHVHSRDRPHKCKICDRSFKQECHLVRHSTIHSGAAKEYQCKICDKHYKQQHRLDRHNLTHNSTYKCKICMKFFAQQWRLNRHICSTVYDYRPTIKPYKCEICNKSFKQRHTLNQHKVEHSCEIHVCKFCNLIFLKKHNIIEHVCPIGENLCSNSGKHGAMGRSFF